MISFPLIEDLKKYSWKFLRSDILAGITVAVILIPQGMAYSMLAGLPPEYGFYAALIPLIVYPFFASSRALSIGPVALMSMIVLSGIGVFAEPGTQKYLDMVLVSALLSGFIQIVVAVLRLGSLSNFLAKPVMDGFLTAAAIIIVASQLKYLFGIDLPRISFFPRMLQEILLHIDEFNYLALAIGLIGIVIIVILKKINNSIPAALILVVVSSLLVYYFQWDKMGIAIIGELPQGLPKFYAGFLQAEYLVAIVPEAFVISIIGYIGSYSIANSIAETNNAPDIVPKSELIGLGVAKMIGSFFLAMPSTGSFTRSFINSEAGARTGMASVFTAIFMGITITFFSSFFYYLSEPVLSAIIITSVFSLISVKRVKLLFNTDRRDFVSFIFTLTLTLLLGIVNGILMGIAWSLVSIVLRASKPHYAILGNLPGAYSYRNIDRFPQAVELTRTLIIRYDQDLFFGNVDHFYQSVIGEFQKRKDIDTIILDSGAMNKPDTAALNKLIRLIDYCRNKKVRLIFTQLSGPPRDLFHKIGISKMLGHENFFLSIRDYEESLKKGVDQDLEIPSNPYAQEPKYNKKELRRGEEFDETKEG